MAREPRELVTVPEGDPLAQYTTGALGQSEFDFNFPYWDDGDLRVFTRSTEPDSEWAERFDYALTPSGGFAQTGYPAGNVTFDPPLVDTEVIIVRDSELSRLTNLPPGQSIDVFSLNRDLNRVVGMLQTLQMQQLSLGPAGEATFDTVINRVLSFNADGSLSLRGVDDDTDPTSLISYTNAVNVADFEAALDAIGHSVWAAFHDSTGTVTVPPSTPSGPAPWSDIAQTWDQFPTADTVWISFSLGREPGINGWWEPIRIVGQDYRPNIYSDPSFAGPHSVTLSPATPPEDLVGDVNGFLSPGLLDVTLPAGGGTTDAIAFVATNGVPTTYAWSWAAGGTGITITSPTAVSTTLSVPTGETSYFGTLRCVASDGVASVTRDISVFIQVEGAAAGVPDTLSAAASPTDLDETYSDATAGYTAFVQINPVGGRLPLSYAWSKVSGSPNLSLSDADPTDASRMRFRSVNPDPTNGGALTATFRCTVRDSAQLDGFTQQVFEVDVPVLVTYNASVDPVPEPPVVAGILPTSLVSNLSAPSDEAGGTIQTQLLVGSAQNATAPITWLWEWESGGAGVTIVSPAAKDTRLQVATDATTFTGVLRLTATDADLRVGTVTIPVTINTASTAPALVASMSPAALSRSVAAGLIEVQFGRASVFASGGTGPYTYAWSSGGLISGSGVFILLDSTSTLPFADFAASRVTASNASTVTATYRFFCTVTDSAFKSVEVQIDVTVTFNGTAGAEGPINIPE